MARPRPKSSPTPWLLLAFVIVLLDQLTKVLVLRGIGHGQRIPVVPGWLDLTLVYNKGAAFSFLAGAGGWQRWFFIGIGAGAALFILYLLWRHASQVLFSWGLSLVLGGAVGNVIDRVLRGQVVDFVLAYREPYFFPAFNVADSAITVGAALLVLDELRRVRAAR